MEDRNIKGITFFYQLPHGWYYETPHEDIPTGVSDKDATDTALWRAMLNAEELIETGQELDYPTLA